MGKFGLKNSKLSVLSENWGPQYLKEADSESRLRLLKCWPQNPFLGKFGPTNSKLLFLPENWCIYHLKMLIPNADLNVWNFGPKIHFWANLSPKTQSCPFSLKTGTHGISRILIFIPTLISWISNPNFFFAQIWAKNVKVVCFNSKLAQMISRGCWFSFQHYFYEFPT